MQFVFITSFYFILTLIFCYEEDEIQEDHKAFLGRRKNEFDELSLEEAKRRLRNTFCTSCQSFRRRLDRLLLPHIDQNKDGFISSKELEVWVREKYESLLELDDADAMFREADVDFNHKVSWPEYLWRHFGIRDNAKDAFTTNLKEQFSEYIIRDTRRWKRADVDMDNHLNENEFHMFVRPKTYAQMMDVVAQEELEEGDEDKDGFLSLDEYIATIHMPDMRSWDERKFHEEYDKNKDGKLNVDEVKIWKTPELYDKSKLEAKHLIDMADGNKDGQLSSDEILLHHFVFVGSKATQSGQMLHDEF